MNELYEILVTEFAVEVEEGHMTRRRADWFLSEIRAFGRNRLSEGLDIANKAILDKLEQERTAVRF